MNLAAIITQLEQHKSAATLDCLDHMRSYGYCALVNGTGLDADHLCDVYGTRLGLLESGIITHHAMLGMEEAVNALRKVPPKSKVRIVTIDSFTFAYKLFVEEDSSNLIGIFRAPGRSAELDPNNPPEWMLKYENLICKGPST